MAPSKKPAGRILKRPGAAAASAAKTGKRAPPPADAGKHGSPPTKKRRLPEVEDEGDEEEEDEESTEDDPVVDPDSLPKSPGKKGSEAMKVTPDRSPKGLSSSGKASIEASLNPLASQLPFHNFADESERKSFRSAVAALGPDQVLCCRLYRRDRSFDTEAIIKMGASHDYEMGPVVEGTLIGCSQPSEDPRLAQLQKDGETLIHLCRQPGHCGRFAEEPHLIHIHEWKSCAAEQVDHPWLTPGMRHQLAGTTRSPRSASGSDRASGSLASASAAAPAEGLPSLPEKPKTVKTAKERAASSDPPSKDTFDQVQLANAAPQPGPKSALQRLKEAAEGQTVVPAAREITDNTKIEELRARLAEAKRKVQEAESADPRINDSHAEDKRGRKSGKEEKAKDKDRDRSRDRDRRPRESLLEKLAIVKAKKNKKKASPSRSDAESDQRSGSTSPRASRKKTRRRRDRKRRRRSSSSSSCSELSEELFHRAGGGNGLASKLVRVARRHPGRLIDKTLDAMNVSLKPGSDPLEGKKPAIMFAYLQKALAMRKSDPRAERELTTVALAVDNILKGNLETALDILAQRFKRVEAEDSGQLHKDLAARLEVIPEARVTCLSLDEQEEVANLDRRWKTYTDGRLRGGANR